MSGRSAIVFATEAGKSQEIAGEIHGRTGIDFLNFGDFPLNEIGSYSLLIFVVPTYGSGDPPESTAAKWQELLDRTEPLNGLKFAVYGLGSTDFGETFVQFAKTLEAKLTALGASEVTALGINDAAGKSSTNFDDWVKGLGVPLQ
jgi:sulfite reductase alpha subunit-like flavoprotein